MRLIAGSGRSGTTWVLDCLADANTLRPVFEPLRPESSRVGFEYAYRMLSPEQRYADLAHHFKYLESPEQWSLWTTYRSPSEKLFPPLMSLRKWPNARRTAYRWIKFIRSFGQLRRASLRNATLFKCIRANLALGWLVANLNAKVVLIVRHPCAVVESQLRLSTDGRSWSPWPILERFRSDGGLAVLTGDAYGALLGSKLTAIESLTLIWVIENQFPVRLASKQGYGVLHYEDLIESPEPYWSLLCRRLDLERVPEVQFRSRPSQQASQAANDSLTIAGAKWKKRLGASQLREIQGILDATGCDLYDTHEVRALSYRK